MLIAGYLSSAIAFVIEATLHYGLAGTRSSLFYPDLFFSALVSLGWFFGGLVGIATVTLERYCVIRARLN